MTGFWQTWVSVVLLFLAVSGYLFVWLGGYHLLGSFAMSSEGPLQLKMLAGTWLILGLVTFLAFIIHLSG